MPSAEPSPVRRSGRPGARPVVLHGEPAAPGIAIARVVRYERETVPVFRVALARREVPAEVRRFEEARTASRRQLREIREATERVLGKEHGYLFEAQLLMLDDPLLVRRVVEVIRTERVNAEWALSEVLRELGAVFEDMADEYLRQRGGDLGDVGGRLLQNLSGGVPAPLDRRERKYVIVAEDLSPSDAAALDWTRIRAVAMEGGSRTYHTVILARTHGVPCVVGARGLLRRARAGVPLIVDGAEGVVVVGPTREMIRDYRNRIQRERRRRERLLAASRDPARMRDGGRVVLAANLDDPSDVELVDRYGADGVGLFRTEGLAASGIPDEETQYRVYRDLAAALDPRPLTIRAFDLGAPEIGRLPEPNPALGLRGTRLLLEASGHFETQIRAVLRAASSGDVRFMFPMVGGLEELRAARVHVRVARRTLRHRGVPFRDVPVGTMLEVPSSAVTADLLAAEADFLSIGTNDLQQYLFGTDRGNESVTRYGDPLHPALLRTVRFIATAASDAEVPLSVCGELAGDPLFIPVLLGFGIRELSMSPQLVPEVKAKAATVDAATAERLAAQAVRLSTARRVRALLLREARAAGSDGAPPSAA